MNVSDSCGIDASLTNSCPPVVEALCFLSLKLAQVPIRQGRPVRRLDKFHFRFFHRGKCKKNTNKTTSRSSHFWIDFLWETFVEVYQFSSLNLSFSASLHYRSVASI